MTPTLIPKSHPTILNFIPIFSDSIPLVHTPRFRQISPINSDNQSEPKDSTDPNDSNPEEEESSVMPSAPAENEDISDASFRKRHAKPELRERNLVKSEQILGALRFVK